MAPSILWHFHSEDPRQALAERPQFTQALRRRFGDAVDTVAAEIVFTELVANVIRHAPGSIDIRLIDDDPAKLEVWDCGPGFDFRPALPPPSAECGRGLYIISRLSTDVRTGRRDGTGAHVTVTLGTYRVGAPRSNGEVSHQERNASNGKT